MRDNGIRVIIGQRKDSKTWDKAIADGWVPGETLFEIEEAAEKVLSSNIFYQMPDRLRFGQQSKNTLHQEKHFIFPMVLESLTKNKQGLSLLRMWM